MLHALLKLEEEEDTQHPVIVAVKECHPVCIQAVQALISKHPLESSHPKQLLVQNNMVFTELEPMELVKVKDKVIKEEELLDQQNQHLKSLMAIKVKVIFSII